MSNDKLALIIAMTMSKTRKSEFPKLSDEQSQARLSYAMTMSKSRKSEFPKLSDEQSQARLSCAMTMSKSRKSEFMCKPNAEPSLLELC